MNLMEQTNPQSAIRNPQSSAAPTLRVVFVGHVDHGKSTLIGRILHDTGSLPEGKIEQIKKACAAEGMGFEFAFLLDALLEEQKQNVTIDTTEIPFRTPRRQYAIIDAPGHKEFLKNMITGASRADAAILVISADEGVREQSRRHAYLLSMLGIKHLIVVVNKMDLVDYSEKRFREIEQEYRKFLRELGLEARTFIPASAREGENVAQASAKMKWYGAASVLEALDSLGPQERDVDLPLRFCVQDVYRFDGRRIIAGRIETGTLRAGDQLVFSPANKSSVVATIERWNAQQNGPAVASYRSSESWIPRHWRQRVTHANNCSETRSADSQSKPGRHLSSTTTTAFRTSDGLSSSTTAKFVVAERFSAASTRIAPLQKAKISFGPREKLPPTREQCGAAIGEQLFG